MTDRASASAEPPSCIRAAVSQYLRHLTIERGLTDNSLAAYRHDLERYSAFLARRGRDDLAAVGADDVHAFVAWMRAAPEDEGLGLAAASTARILSAVRGLHRFLLDEGELDTDATADIARPKRPSRLPHALTIDQVDRLLQAARTGDDPESLRNSALLELLYASGARISEAVGLDVDDVAGRDMVRVRGKGGKQRMVPLGSYARSALDAYLVRARPVLATRGRGTPALFLGVRGGRLSRQSVWQVLQVIAARADLGEHISPHTLRHSFATHLVQGGADVRVVQELLGHASVSTTQIYTQVTADALRDMYLTAHPRARG